MSVTTSPLPSKLNYPDPTSGESVYEEVFDSYGTCLKSLKTSSEGGAEDFYSLYVNVVPGQAATNSNAVLDFSWDSGTIDIISNDDDLNLVSMTSDTIFSLSPGYIYEIFADVALTLTGSGTVSSQFNYWFEDSSENIISPTWGGQSNSGVALTDGTDPEYTVTKAFDYKAHVKVEDEPMLIKMVYQTDGVDNEDALWQYSPFSYMLIKTVATL